jgi:hypothetical protein
MHLREALTNVAVDLPTIVDVWQLPLNDYDQQMIITQPLWSLEIVYNQIRNIERIHAVIGKLTPAASDLLSFIATYGGDVPLSFLLGARRTDIDTLMPLLTEVTNQYLAFLHSKETYYRTDEMADAVREPGVYLGIPSPFLPHVSLTDSARNSLIWLIEASPATVQRQWLGQRLNSNRTTFDLQEGAWFLYGLLTVYPPTRKEVEALDAVPRYILSLLSKNGFMTTTELFKQVKVQFPERTITVERIQKTCELLMQRPLCFWAQEQYVTKAQAMTGWVVPREWREILA